MDGIWWTKESDLIDEQRDILRLDEEDSCLIEGPPGSGKTNILLLRANYLILSGLKRVALITFTRTLKEFIQKGAENYNVPSEKIYTLHSWTRELIVENGGSIPEKQKDLSQDRSLVSSRIKSLIENENIGKIYDAILIDEAQDLTEEEAKIILDVSDRVFAVADNFQKIYDESGAVEILKKSIGSRIKLKFHHRSGKAICDFADAIHKGKEDYTPLSLSCNYDESKSPSSVEIVSAENRGDYFIESIARIENQIDTYPNELIGILFPTRDLAEEYLDFLESSNISHRIFTHLGDDAIELQAEKPVFVGTMHSAKGLEFRALHLMGLEEISKTRSQQKKLAYMSATRAKTSLTVYRFTTLPAYLEAAIATALPKPTKPTIEDLFTGGSL